MGVSDFVFYEGWIPASGVSGSARFQLTLVRSLEGICLVIIRWQTSASVLPSIWTPVGSSLLHGVVLSLVRTVRGATLTGILV